MIPPTLEDEVASEDIQSPEPDVKDEGENEVKNDGEEEKEPDSESVNSSTKKKKGALKKVAKVASGFGSVTKAGQF